jgi:hypothetical protein
MFQQLIRQFGTAGPARSSAITRLFFKCCATDSPDFAVS